MEIMSAPLARLRADARTEIFERRFARLHVLSDGERDMLRRIGASPTQRYGPRTLITLTPAAPKLFLLTGWVGRVRQLTGGRRQIISVAMPGDELNPHPSLAGRNELLKSLTPVQTVVADRIYALAATAAGAGIAAGLQAAASLYDAFLLDQIVRLGRQTAFERIAHFLLELRYRSDLAGLAIEGSSFPMPLTQENIADTLGLSVVHVNRTLQVMRRTGLIRLKSGQLTLLSPEKLAEICEFYHPLIPSPIEVQRNGSRPATAFRTLVATQLGG